MPERGRHDQRSDVYSEYKSRDFSHNGERSLYHGQSGNQKPADVEQRGPSGDRRTKENRQREMRSAPHTEAPSSRDHDHEVPSRL